MSRALVSKRGMGLPAMLGIVAFLLASSTFVLTFVINDAFAVNRDVINKTEYKSAVNAIDATINVFRHKLLNGEPIDIEDPIWDIFGVNITTFESGFRIARPIGSRQVVSYLNAQGGYMFSETRALIDNESLKTANLLDVFIDSRYLATPYTVPTFRESVNILKDMYNNITPAQFPSHGQINQSTYVSGGLNPRNNGNILSINVSSGQVLVIDGNLIIDANGFNVSGIVIIMGNLEINNNFTLRGSLYVGGSVTAKNNSTIGFADDLSFIFAQGAISIHNLATMSGFIISDTSVTINNNSNLSGGVYSHGTEPIINGPDPTPLDASIVSSDEIGKLMIDCSTSSSSLVLATRPRYE